METAGAPLVLLDDALRADGGALLLSSPLRIIVAQTPAEVEPALAAIERALAGGLYAAGFLAYELGYLLEPQLAPLLPAARTVPLLWIGLFEAPQRLDAAAVRRWLPSAGAGVRVHDLHPSMDRRGYHRAFAQARALIAAGEAYQINLTLKLDFRYEGDPFALYAALRRRQRVGHGAFIAAGDFHVLSLSPELFVRIRDGRIQVRPMKGTAPRAPTPAEDADVIARLQADEKSRAENLMIVDLLRNDLSRLSPPGRVKVTDLFTIETYRSLHQMTSAIEATCPAPSLRRLLGALFPCGSVTGAPKIRAMQIIRALETRPRGVYCGAIGLLAPNGDAFFNVAIRTLLCRPDGHGELGIGSGVVFDSEADAEYDECLLKAAFLTRPEPPLALIETLAWQPGSGYLLLSRHLDRLVRSARWFAMPCDAGTARRALAEAAAAFTATPMRVRLLLDEDGGIAVTAGPVAARGAASLRWRLAEKPVSSRDPLLYHKTTRRERYDAELAAARAAGCDEVLFHNERGALTEGAWTNLFVRRGGRLLTPPVSCGLLDGTLRRELLETGAAAEAVLHRGDLADAEAVLFGNSVRGLMPAQPSPG